LQSTPRETKREGFPKRHITATANRGTTHRGPRRSAPLTEDCQVSGSDLLLGANWSPLVHLGILREVSHHVPANAGQTRSRWLGSGLRKAVGRDVRDKVSPVLYLAGIALAFVIPGWECWS
jgi:hypothetical protein